MSTRELNNRPRLAAALQIALLIGVFQGVVATTPSQPTRQEAGGVTTPATPRSPLNPPQR